MDIKGGLELQLADPIERRLVDDLRDRRVIPFIGSGLSAQCKLPDAGQLAEKMWKDLHPGKTVPRRPLSLLETAHRYRTKFSKGQVWRFLQDQFRVPTKASPAHTALARLPARLFITTNYDKLLETALQDVYGNPPYIVLDASGFLGLSRWSHYERPILVKLHGDIDNYESIVLTQQDYTDFMESKGDLIEALSREVAKQPFLFVGYSLVDPDIHAVFERANEIAGGMTQAYILVSGKPGKSLHRNLTRLNINAILYGSYESLPAYLHKIADYSHSSMIPQSPSLFSPPVRHNLPEVGPVYGRQQDIDRLLRLCDLAGDTPKPIVLTGPKGIGKSTIAIRAAHDLISGKQVDFAVFLDFRSWPRSVPQTQLGFLQTVLQSLGFHVGATDEQAVLAILFNIFRRTRGVLVLDNFEDRQGPDAIAFAKRTALQQTQVIVTSTDVPFEDGEIFFVQPLDAAAMHTIAGKWMSDSNRADDARDLDTLIDRAEGNPALLLWGLALAEKITMGMALNELGREKSKHDGRFVSRFLRLFPRSYSRTILSAALLPAPVETGLLQRTCNISSEELKWLIDRNVLTTWVTGDGCLVRAHSLFATIDLEDDEVRSAVAGLKKEWINIFCGLCEEAGHRNFTKYYLLDRELKNIAKAIEWSAELEPERAIQMLLTLDDFLYIRGEYQLRYELGMSLLPIAKERGMFEAEGELLLNPIGESLWHLQAGAKAALEEFRQAREAFRQGGSDEGEGWALYYSGRVLRSMNEPKEAEGCLLEALQRSGENDRLHAFILNSLGNLERTRGEVAKAEEFYLESLHIWEGKADKEMIAVVKRNLGFLAKQSLDFGRAEALFKDALVLHEELNQVVESGEIHQALGELAIESHDIAVAKQHLSQARERYLSSGSALMLLRLVDTMSKLASHL